MSLASALCVLHRAPGQEAKALLQAPLVVLPVGAAPFRRLGDLDGDGDADPCARVVARGTGHFGPAGGVRRQVGTGPLGEAGSRRVWGACGPFRGGETERLVLRGVSGPTIAVLGLSLGGSGRRTFPGIALRLDLGSLVTETANVVGRAAASAEFPVTLPPGFQGLEFHSQAFVFDAAAPFGLTCRNSLAQRIGPGTGASPQRGARRSLVRDRPVP